MTVTVKITKDRVAQVMAQAQRLDNRQVVVGFPSSTSSRRSDEITNASLAYIHEFGSPAANIPARPFLVPGVKNATRTIPDVIKRAVQKALMGDAGAMEQALNAIGVMAVDAVQHKIRTGPHAPLAQETIKRKKSSRPLIDTGQMIQSVSYVIRDRRR